MKNFRFVGRAILISVLSLLLACVQEAFSWKTPSVSKASSTLDKKFLRQIAKSVATASLLQLPISPILQPAQAFGPVEMKDFKIKNYENVELCDGKKPIMPGQKAMEGLYPACIEVEATLTNPNEKTYKDVSVYGMVKENEAGNSVLPNNPDFSTDAGQYAMIKKVLPGEQNVRFQFVVATTKNPLKGEKIPDLTFFNQKAVSMPGGNKFVPLDECEIDPRAEGCEDNERDNRGRDYVKYRPMKEDLD